jgi:hypothetical protein
MGTTIEYNDESSMIPFTLEDGTKTVNFTDLHGDNEQHEIVGTDLKQLIENELNTGM